MSNFGVAEIASNRTANLIWVFYEENALLSANGKYLRNAVRRGGNAEAGIAGFFYGGWLDGYV